MSKKQIEKRNIEMRGVKTNADNLNKMILEGVATVFDTPTVLYEIDGIEYKEIIDRHALDKADFSNCCLKYNHSNNVPIMARTRKGSLKTSIDDEGLHFRANLFNTQTSRDVYELVKVGGLDKCSFAFTVEDAEYDKNTHTRRILKIDKVFDISIVDVPAYDDTDVSARSLFKLENEKEKTKAKELENSLERKRLLLKLFSY